MEENTTPKKIDSIIIKDLFLDLLIYLRIQYIL